MRNVFQLNYATDIYSDMSYKYQISDILVYIYTAYVWLENLKKKDFFSMFSFKIVFKEFRHIYAS